MPESTEKVTESSETKVSEETVTEPVPAEEPAGGVLDKDAEESESDDDEDGA